MDRVRGFLRCRLGDLGDYRKGFRARVGARDTGCLVKRGDDLRIGIRIGGLAQIDHYEIRAAGSGTEAFRAQVVGDPGGRAFGAARVIGESLPQAERRYRQQADETDCPDCRKYRPLLQPPGVRRPSLRGSRTASGLATPGQSPSQGPCAQQSQQCRQHPDGGQHDDDHGHRCTNGKADEEVDSNEQQSEKSDDDGESGEDNRSTGCLDGHQGCLLLVLALQQTLSVAVQDEQGVVDAHRQADHRRERRREGRNIEEVRHESHEQHAGSHAHDGRKDRQSGSDDRTESDEQNDKGEDHADDLAARGLTTGPVENLTFCADRYGI